MSYLQAFNFSNPFSVPNFNPFGGGAGLSHLGSSIQTRFGTQSPAGTTYTTTASNQLLVNHSPQSPAAAAASNLQIPESIVPNYNPNAATDYYGNPNQNFASQQAPIPQEYQQQQAAQQQLQQQQLQQQQFQQQQIQQQQQAQHQLQIHAAQLQIRPQVVQAIPDPSEVTDRSANKDGFDVIIREGNGDDQSAEQLTELEQQQLLSQPPTSRIGRRKKQRKPPRVVNYAPVEQVHYVPPAGIGPHFVSFHPKQKFSVHDVIEDHQSNANQLRLNNPNSNNVPNANIIDTNENTNLPGQSTANSNNVQPQFQSAKTIAPPPNFPQSNPVQNAPVSNDNDDADVIEADPADSAQNNGGPPPQQLQNNQGAIDNNVNSARDGVAEGSGAAPASDARSGEGKQKEKLRVTPIQGPIFAKDGMVPVVPLFSYPVKNGTYQIPILWTALSYALGLEIHGEILRGLPCIKRLNQLYCPTAGQSYPRSQIEGFIDENKALIRRMYGEFTMSSEAYSGPPGGNTLRRSTRDVFEDEVPDVFGDSKKAGKNHHKTKRSASAHHSSDHDGLDFLDEDHPSGNGTLTAHIRATRQTVNNRNGSPSQQPRSNRIDSCESTVEIVTPYWAANSGGKVRAIVNTQHFEQAIHQEVCRHTSTRRCSGECGCEQKYKWHRLLAYDPDNDCRGIFMDWFLFPSCCVCRCNPQSG